MGVFERVCVVRNDEEAVLGLRNGDSNNQHHTTTGSQNVYTQIPPPKQRGYDTTNRFPIEAGGGVPPLLSVSSGRDWSEIVSILSTVPTFPNDARTAHEENEITANNKFGSFVTSSVRRAFKQNDVGSNKKEGEEKKKKSKKNTYKIPTMTQVSEEERERGRIINARR